MMKWDDTAKVELIVQRSQIGVLVLFMMTVADTGAVMMDAAANAKAAKIDLMFIRALEFFDRIFSIATVMPWKIFTLNQLVALW